MKKKVLLPLVIASLLMAAAARERTYMGHRVFDRNFLEAFRQAIARINASQSPPPAPLRSLALFAKKEYK